MATLIKVIHPTLAAGCFKYEENPMSVDFWLTSTKDTENSRLMQTINKGREERVPYFDKEYTYWGLVFKLPLRNGFSAKDIVSPLALGRLPINFVVWLTELIEYRSDEYLEDKSPLWLAEYLKDYKILQVQLTKEEVNPVYQSGHTLHFID